MALGSWYLMCNHCHSNPDKIKTSLPQINQKSESWIVSSFWVMGCVTSLCRMLYLPPVIQIRSFPTCWRTNMNFKYFYARFCLNGLLPSKMANDCIISYDLTLSSYFAVKNIYWAVSYINVITFEVKQFTTNTLRDLKDVLFLVLDKLSKCWALSIVKLT